MLHYNQHPDNRSIMVSILGEPNVGKSSLINNLLGYDLSAVTDKPQTTRNKFHCVVNIDKVELILVDTPGFHFSGHEINKRYNQQALDGANGNDVNLLLIDPNKDVVTQVKNFVKKFDLDPAALSEKERAIKEKLARGNGHREGYRRANIDQNNLWIAFNKIDKILSEGASNSELDGVGVEKVRQVFIDQVKSNLPFLVDKFFFISSKNGTGIHELTAALYDNAPSSPHLYSEDRISNKNERFFVCEYIREQAFNLLKEEVPYELAVVIDNYLEGAAANACNANYANNNGVEEDRRERANESVSGSEKEKLVARIEATILVNRPSQRAIVIGKGGGLIKEIGIRSRKRIEELLGGKVFLGLHVKVCPRWFCNNSILKDLGLPMAKDSVRVWRKRD